MGRCEADDVPPVDSLLDRPAVLAREHLSRSVEGDVGVSVQADEVFVAGVLHGSFLSWSGSVCRGLRELAALFTRLLHRWCAP